METLLHDTGFTEFQYAPTVADRSIVTALKPV
jgi:hypothetical protein